MGGELPALAPDELDARAAPAGADARRGPAVRAEGPDLAAAGYPRRPLAPLGVRARTRARPARSRRADRGLRRGAVVQLPHAPARAARRPRPALHARRAYRADSAAGAAPCPTAAVPGARS